MSKYIYICHTRLSIHSFANSVFRTINTHHYTCYISMADKTKPLEIFTHALHSSGNAPIIFKHVMTFHCLSDKQSCHGLCFSMVYFSVRCKGNSAGA